MQGANRSERRSSLGAGGTPSRCQQERRFDDAHRNLTFPEVAHEAQIEATQPIRPAVRLTAAARTRPDSPPAHGSPPFRTPPASQQIAPTFTASCLASPIESFDFMSGSSLRIALVNLCGLEKGLFWGQEVWKLNTLASPN